MGDNHNQDSMHWVMGGALLLIGAFVAIVLVMLNSQADTINTSANINNVGPTIVDVYMTTGADYTQSDNTGGAGGAITLNNGGAKIVKVTGTVEDLNGAGDLNGVSLVFFNSATTAGCAGDNNNCYKSGVNGVPACSTQAGPTSDQLDFNCTVSLQFYTDSSAAGGPDSTKDWVIEVSVKDIDNVSVINNTLHKEINTLLALNIPNALNFGTIALNTSTAAGNNQEMTIEQFGNDEADVEVSMPGALTCSVRGNIPLASVKWALTDVDWANVGSTAMTSSAVDTDLNVGYRTNDATPLTKILYWNVATATGQEGSCTNNMTITTIVH